MSSYCNVIMQGDALATLRGLDDGCVQMVCTSPPYYGLRDYNVEGQIGLEQSPAEYIDNLVEVFRELWRVLRSDGVCWLNLGDSYAHDGKWGGATGGKHAQALHGTDKRRTRRTTGFKNKDLMMMPARVAIALQDDGWWIRNDAIWHKPTAMPEPVTDRFVTAHEHIFLLTKNERYYFDTEAVREPLKLKTFTTYGCQFTPQDNDALGLVKSSNWNGSMQQRQPRLAADGTYAGSNKRDVLTAASQPFPGAHFATMPPKLVEPLILAGSSPQACEHCGSPWRRQVLKELIANPGGGQKRASTTNPNNSPIGSSSVFRTGMSKISHTTGWQPTCSCDNTGSGRCIVLDPFAGAGTSCYVASRFGRDYLGIELNPEYVALAEKRLADLHPGLWGFSERAAQGK